MCIVSSFSLNLYLYTSRVTVRLSQKTGPQNGTDGGNASRWWLGSHLGWSLLQTKNVNLNVPQKSLTDCCMSQVTNMHPPPLPGKSPHWSLTPLAVSAPKPHTPVTYLYKSQHTFVPSCCSLFSEEAQQFILSELLFSPRSGLVQWFLAVSA